MLISAVVRALELIQSLLQTPIRTKVRLKCFRLSEALGVARGLLTIAIPLCGGRQGTLSATVGVSNRRARRSPESYCAQSLSEIWAKLLQDICENCAEISAKFVAFFSFFNFKGRLPHKLHKRSSPHIPQGTKLIKVFRWGP